MPRVQLAINVSNIGDAVAFYSKVFNAEPAKRREGYANFAIAEPPLKLVLIEKDGTPGSLNHLGIEVEGRSQVQTAVRKFVAQDVATDVEEGVTCCYAVQDKVWVTDPDGARWEVYTVLADADQMAPALADGGPGTCSCEAPAADAKAEPVVARVTISGCC